MENQNTQQPERKKGKGCLTAIVIFIFLGILGSCLGESEDSAEGTTQAETSTKVESTTQESTTEKEDKNEKKRKEAKEIDEQFTDIARKTDASYGKLLNGIQKIGDNEQNANILEFYNLAKAVKEDCFLYFREANHISYKGAENYKDSLLTYITTCQSVAENFMKYIDKSEMKYLSKAQELMEAKNTIALQLATDELQFLSDSGFTTDEIDKMLNK